MKNNSNNINYTENALNNQDNHTNNMGTYNGVNIRQKCENSSFRQSFKQENDLSMKQSSSKVDKNKHLMKQLFLSKKKEELITKERDLENEIFQLQYKLEELKNKPSITPHKHNSSKKLKRAKNPTSLIKEIEKYC